jgi:ribosome biogenesis GTPase
MTSSPKKSAPKREASESAEAAPLDATVARLDARGCVVFLDRPTPGVPGDGRTLWCSVRGVIHLRDRPGQKTPLVAGDRVRVVPGGGDRGAVVELLPRRSMLSRPAVRKGRVEHVMAANVDGLAIVTAAAEPAFTPGLVDRMLAVAAWCRLDAMLVVNKIDLAEGAPPEIETYRALGVPVVLASATRGDGVEELRRALRGRTTVVAGHSGVGKSSLLNAVQPGLGLAVGEVNVVSGRGTHTTTAAVWAPLAEGGAVIDTAGVREFGLFGIPPRDLGWLFPDLAAVAPECRYPDCSHLHEPGCAVRGAVEEGRLARFRYESYLRILEGMGESERA